jgi:MrcB-like, N-terminal domain
LAAYAPAGTSIIGSGGKGGATYTPWIGWFDPDETDSPRIGIYVVYLLSEDKQRWALTLNQGIEVLRAKHGGSEARKMLQAEATAIETQLGKAMPAAFRDAIDLRSSGDRHQAYEAGNIACRMYDATSMPTDDELRETSFPTR